MSNTATTNLPQRVTTTALTSFTDVPRSQQPVNVAQVRHISPFRYPGGKTWFVPTVREYLHRIERPHTFLEPFAGGATIGLTIAAENLADHVVLVELDDDVAAVWEVLLNASDRSVTTLSNKILRFATTVENVRTILDSTPRTIIDHAFRTIIKNRCGHGGIIAPGAGLIKTGEKNRGIASRWYPETLVKRFTTIRQFRERVTFQHGDALEAITHHPGATLFVDPPYTAAGKRAGARLYTHTTIDHENLFRTVNTYAHSALLTYDDTQEIRTLAHHHHFEVGTVDMKSNHHALMHELIIVKHPHHQTCPKRKPTTPASLVATAPSLTGNN